MTTTYYAPRFDVKVSGLTMAADVTEQVVSVSYDNNVDLADMFTVILRNEDNSLTDSPLFDLRKDVEIHMGYGSDLTPMMLGEITAVQPSFPQSGAPTISVSGYDKSYRMRHGQPDRVPWEYVPDAVIAAQIAAENLLIPVVDPTPRVQEYVQQTTSDFAFLKDLARGSFFDVYVEWDKLYFRFPRPQTEAYALEWGKNLSRFSPRVSTAAMAGIQVIRSYNEDLAQTILGFATAAQLDLDNIVEKLGSTALDMLLDLGRRVVRNQSIESPIDALTFAKSLLQEILDGMYEGNGSCIGIPDLKAGEMISIRGVGDRFSGKYRLKKVTHTIDASGYHTSFEVTQRAGSSVLGLLRRSIVESPPPNSRESFTGVVVGTVSNNIDPRARGRVRVRFPWFSDLAESAWARCSTPMAGSSRGMYFLPDIGDEVLVAFEHGNFNKPVVVGSLWNGVKRPPQTHVDGLNRIRQFKTGAGHEITLDDTPGAGQVTVKHGLGSSVTFGPDGSVTVDAKGTLTLKSLVGIVLDAPTVSVP